MFENWLNAINRFAQMRSKAKEEIWTASVTLSSISAVAILYNEDCLRKHIPNSVNTTQLYLIYAVPACRSLH